MRPYVNAFGITLGLLFQIKLIAQQIDFHCTKVNTTGDITLLWQSSGLPSGYQYEIYGSTSKTGTYTLLGTISNLLTTTYAHLSANGDNQQWFYVIKAVPILPTTGPEYVSDTTASIYFAMNNLGSGRALLYWERPHDPPLASESKTFIINQERNAVWNEWKRIDTLVYADTVHVCGEMLGYEIRLYDSIGCESVSTVRTDFFTDFISPSIPQLDSVSVNPLTGKIELGWEPGLESDIVGYLIYIFDRVNSTWNVVDTILGANKTHYIDTVNDANTAIQQYRIAAIDTCRNASPMGKIHNTLSLDVSIEKCDSMAFLSWNAYLGMPDSVTGYRIWISEDGINYTLIDSVLSDKLSYTHRELNPIKKYTYFVQAYNVKNGYSSSSTTKQIEFNRQESSGNIILRYVSVVDNRDIEIVVFISDTVDYQHLILLRREENRTTFYPLETKSKINGVEIYSFRDNNVNVQEYTYRYSIALTDECDHIFTYSDTGNNIVLQVKGSTVDEIEIQWKPYYGFKNRLDGYDILQKTQTGSSFLYQGSVPPAQLDYTKNVWGNANEGSEFSYQVVANENNTNVQGFQDRSYSNTVEIRKEAITYIPNVFYPESSIEANRIFKPINSYVDVEEYVFSIYDRWGSLLFITNDISMGWDGATQGKPAMAGVYTYIITYRIDEKTLFKKQGQVTLLR
ncbi:MAG: gliding motility-associated C-terminal domain-containing protein [Bacteroidales bacterium]|jgi:gliding motility-associated-like protein|nr:gliding motility-associated C-terminal domain-containing protein [Bacteroidales bacterium]